jgi:hypothetical protein
LKPEVDMSATNSDRGSLDSSVAASERNGRRRRWEVAGDNLRYFLPKSGSSSDCPELGEEMTTEGEALVQAFKSGQLFYTVVAWMAVPEINGNEPRIVKQAVTRD